MTEYTLLQQAVKYLMKINKFWYPTVHPVDPPCGSHLLHRLLVMHRIEWVLNVQIICVLHICHFQIYTLKVILALLPVLIA